MARRPKEGGATERLHISMTSEARKELEALRDRVGCATTTEVVQRALRAYRKLTEFEEQRDVKIVALKADGESSEVLPLV